MYEKGSTDVPYTNTASNTTTEKGFDFGSPVFRRFRFGYFVLLSVLACIGSLNLFLTLWRKGFFKIHFYLFVGHLSLIYCIFGVFVLPFYIVQFTLEGQWPFGVGLCITFNIVHNICVYEMQVTVVLVAADRLWAMRWPLHYRAHRNFRNMMLTLALSWIYCCFTVLPTVIHDRITQSYNATVCSLAITPNFQYWKATITMGFLVPSLIALSIYGTIFYITVVRLCGRWPKISAPIDAVSQSCSFRGQTGPPSPAVPARDGHDLGNQPNVRMPRNRFLDKTAGGTLIRINTLREKRVLSIMLIVVINFLVCLLPYATYCVLWFYHLMAPNRYFFTIGHLLLFSHPVLDTFAFTFTNKELRPSLKCWKRSRSETVSTSEERKP